MSDSQKLGWVLAGVSWLLCAMASGVIAKAKERPGSDAWIGLLLGPLGLFVEAVRPGASTIYRSPDGERVQRQGSRLGWLTSSTPAVILTLAAIGVSGWSIYQAIVTPSGYFDGQAAASSIQSQLRSQGAPQAVVTCPTRATLQAGLIVDCTATDPSGTVTLRVVQDDAAGHFHWAAEGS